jgi:hypothetical protein
MRREMMLRLMAVFLGFALVGCATNAPLIQARSHSNRDGIFSEVTGQGAIPKGYADLEINASIKTRPEGYFLLEPRDSVQGKPSYPFLLNVDGQAVTWKVDGHQEITPRYLEDGDRNPEGGTGIRYVLDRRIRLVAGTHRVFFGLPGEDFIREFDVTLKDGRGYVLRFAPVYKWRSSARSRHFVEGLSGYDKMLTEKCPD